MNCLGRKLRLCTALNENNVQLRQKSDAKRLVYDVKTVIDMLKTENKAAAGFDLVAKNTIHRANLIEGGAAFVYSGSMSTIPKAKLDYLKRPTVKLTKMIDFHNKQTRDKLTIETMKCPRLLFDTLEKVFPFYSFPELNIVQLSFENYDDLQQGRKDCLLAANQLVVILNLLNRWAYFSAVAAPISPDDKYLCLFESPSTLGRKETAAELHAQVTSEDGCVTISGEPFDKSVGIIYTNMPKSVELLRHLLLDCRAK